MIISSLEIYKEKLLEDKFSALVITAARGSATRLSSYYSALAPSSYPTPTTASALSASTYPENISNIEYPFDVFQSNANIGTYSVIGARMNPTAGGFMHGGYIFVDRLSHQGGLNATGTGAQTTNLPTAALPRYTDGRDVMLGLEIYTQIGSTATTITVSYTNELGTSGKTTPAIVFGGTGAREVGRFFVFPLQNGDSGIKSVQSVTVSATTGTAGNFGIVLFKPLFMVPINNTDGPHICDLISGNFIGYPGELPRQTNISIIATGTNTTGTGVGSLIFAFSDLP